MHLTTAARQMAAQWRKTFTCEKTINWFPGHMAKGIKQMRDRLRAVDLIVEMRDARIPLSSINRQLEQLAGKKQRLVVYNKADLAPAHVQSTVERELAMRMGKSQDVLFASATATAADAHNVERVLAAARAVAERGAERQCSMMVVGMPNVGKSSLVNALRRVGSARGKAAATGARPGVTRALGNRVRVLESPPVYVFDTPGVMAPHIADPETAVKVALTGGISDDATDTAVLADYLLFRLNRLPDIDYCRVLRIERATDDLSELVAMLGARIGALRKGGEVDSEKTIAFFLRAYRDGKLGNHCLDDLDSAALDAFFAALAAPAPLSRNQEKMAKRAEQRRRSLEKNKARRAEQDRHALEKS
ncbi:Mitochondrial GTPase 1 [Coemansia sp. RSA 1939]|nr:Mitochondrial GTPase 1 [Coemansia sp. RSA 1939]